MESELEVNGFWPSGVEFTDDLTPAGWIGPRLMPLGGRGIGTPAGAVIPTGYPAYVRLLHPVSKGSERRYWKDLVEAAHLVYHPLIQWERLPLALRREIDHQYGAPATGTMASSLRKALLVHLAGETRTPEQAYYGIWEGSGLLYGGYWYVGEPRPGQGRRRVELESLRRMLEGRPRFALPGRDYLLAHGSLEELVNFPDDLTPNLIWPEDRAFCCATEIDFDSTLVGLSVEGARQILEDENLEALPIRVEDPLDASGDTLNAMLGPVGANSQE